MTELHLYVADDGTKFEDEEECLQYEAENRAKELKGRVVLLDNLFRPIPLPDLSQWENACFIYAKDVQALRDLTGINPPHFLFEDKAGLFSYDENSDKWYHMGTRIQAIQYLADRAMKIINENL